MGLHPLGKSDLQMVPLHAGFLPRIRRLIRTADECDREAAPAESSHVHSSSQQSFPLHLVRNGNSDFDPFSEHGADAWRDLDFVLSDSD